MKTGILKKFATMRMFNETASFLTTVALLLTSNANALGEVSISIQSVDSSNNRATVNVKATSGERHQIMFSRDLKTWAPTEADMVGDGGFHSIPVSAPFKTGFFKVVSLEETGGWMAGETGDDQFGLAMAHANGDSIFVNTTKDEAGKIQRINGYAWRQPNGVVSYYEIDELGLPKSISSGGDIITFEGYSDDFSSATISYLKSDGTGDMATVQIPVVPEPLDPNTPIETEDGVNWPVIAKSAKYVIGGLGCAFSVGMTWVTLGASLPFAIAGCGSFALSVIADLTDNEGLKRASVAVDITSAIMLAPVAPWEFADSLAAALIGGLTVSEFEFQNHQQLKNSARYQNSRERIVEIYIYLDPDINWWNNGTDPTAFYSASYNDLYDANGDPKLQIDPAAPPFPGSPDDPTNVYRLTFEYSIKLMAIGPSTDFPYNIYLAVNPTQNLLWVDPTYPNNYL